MVPLAIILLVRDADHSYAAAGAVVAAYTIALAATAPFLGRLADRLGQTRVLVPVGVLFPAALASLAPLAHGGADATALAAAAAVAGALLPPLGASIRALWPTLLPSADLRDTAFALEAALQEVFFVVGPLLVAGLSVAASPAAALLLAAACGSIGTLALAGAPAARAWSGATRDHAGLLGALGAPGVRTVLMACLAMGGAFGALELSMPAFAEQHGNRAAGGIAAAALSLGSLIGGVWAGTRGPARRPPTRFLAVLCAFAAALLLPLAADSIATLTVLVLVAGVPIAPAFASAYGLVDDLALRGTITEAFAWISTAVVAGVSIGTSLGGLAIHRFGVAAALALAGGCGWLAALAVAVRRPTLERTAY